MQRPPLISVITRTAGRPIFLARCYDHLKQAAVPDTEWIVVDDLGEGTDAIQDVLDRAAADGVVTPRLIISAARSRPMAGNAGLSEARGAYLHLYDDDDTIAPAFYRRLAAALDSDRRLGAAASRARHVWERIGDDRGTVVSSRSTPHYPELRAVTIAGMAVTQMTPPVSLLFRLDAIRTVGQFDPAFAVCEDHEFLLRFLLHFDIALVDEELASFHERVVDPQLPKPLWNSAVTQNFEAETAYFRNAMLRRDFNEGRIGLGWLLAIAELTRGATKLDRILTQLRRFSSLRVVYERLRR